MPVSEERSAAAGGWIGRSVRPRETLRPIRGLARYLDDLVLPRTAALVVVRSPVAHARVRAIAADAARRAPGALAVLTGADLAGRIGAYPVVVPEGGTVVQVPHPVLAGDTVRYAGEPVAAVAAEDLAAALDVAALVHVEYDPLPAVVDPRASVGGPVRLHDAAPDNVLSRWRRTHGDVEGAFAGAARVVRGRFRIPRLVGAPIEPRGALAAYDPGGDVLTVWCSCQDPHRPLAQLSRVLRRPDDRIRVIVPEVGGAFGVKGIAGPEVMLAALLAIDLGRPVKWVEGRRENFLATYHGRGMDAEMEMAVDRDGRIRGVRARLIADLGAYQYPPTANVPTTAAMLLTGVYAIPAVDVELVGAATNKVPTGPYRGAGRPEAAYLVERMVDLVARELALDPIEVRRRNFVPPDRFPYPNGLGFTYDSGNYARALDRALDLARYGARREEQRRARAAGRLFGVGVGMSVERAGSLLWEAAAATVHPTGRVVVRIGSTPQGQGHETVFAQIVADRLGVELDAVTVEHGDSAVVPRGVGTFGSRSTTIGGAALWSALEKIRAKATRIAAHLLEAAPDDLERTGDRFAVRGAPGRAVTLREVAAAAYQPGRQPPGDEMGLDAAATFSLPAPVFPSGAYVATVEVMRETGEIRIHALDAVDDAGRIVNPLLAEAQVVGAAVQALGEVLLEEAVYDEDGQLVTGTFLDYGLPRAALPPRIEGAFVETPTPYTALGAKGVGEAGCIATPGAVANAVIDALAPLGIRHVDLPFTPEKVWRAIRDAEEGRRGGEG